MKIRLRKNIGQPTLAAPLASTIIPQVIKDYFAAHMVTYIYLD
jgi:hypothetical protein